MMSVIKGVREGMVAFTRTVGNPDHSQSMLDDMIINSIQDYLYSAFYNAIVAKQLHKKLSF